MQAQIQHHEHDLPINVFLVIDTKGNIIPLPEGATLNYTTYTKFYPGRYTGPWEDSYPDEYDDDEQPHDYWLTNNVDDEPVHLPEETLEHFYWIF